jgi:transposase
MSETRHYAPGSDGGAHHWAMAMTLIQTAKLNGVNSMAHLADVLGRGVSGQTKRNKSHALLPWNWTASTAAAITNQAAAAG